jgi:hypothetical protein
MDASLLNLSASHTANYTVRVRILAPAMALPHRAAHGRHRYRGAWGANRITREGEGLQPLNSALDATRLPGVSSDSVTCQHRRCGLSLIIIAHETGNLR